LSVSPSMSPLIATRFVAPDGMVVPVGQTVEVGVVGAGVMGDGVVDTVVVAGSVVAAAVVGVVAATTVVVVAGFVVGAGAVEAEALVAVDEPLSSQPANASIRAAVAEHATHIVRPPLTDLPLRSTNPSPSILAGRSTHSREHRCRS
jgi:predicted homoserine dehydrogenase-like protein